jgi:hypothetical protein
VTFYLENVLSRPIYSEEDALDYVIGPSYSEYDVGTFRPARVSRQADATTSGRLIESYLEILDRKAGNLEGVATSRAQRRRSATTALGPNPVFRTYIVIFPNRTTSVVDLVPEAKPSSLTGVRARPKAQQPMHPPALSGLVIEKLVDVLTNTASTHLPTKSLADFWEHTKFLLEVSTVGEHPPITREVAGFAHQAWREIWIASDFQMPIPSACTGPDGQMFYSWDMGRHHLELEISPDMSALFFYRDRQTAQVWSEDYHLGEHLSYDLSEKIKFFVGTPS